MPSRPHYADSRCPACGEPCRVIALREEIDWERGTMCGPWGPYSECHEAYVNEAKEEG